MGTAGNWLGDSQRDQGVLGLAIAPPNLKALLPLKPKVASPPPYVTFSPCCVGGRAVVVSSSSISRRSTPMLTGTKVPAAAAGKQHEVS